MHQTIKCLTELLKSAVTGEKVNDGIGYEDRFDGIIKLSRLHEVSGIAAYSMLKNGLDGEHYRGIAEKEMFKASFNDTRNTYTYELASDLLNNAGIDFVPLKGLIIKNYYPERFMRTSCDIDILVRKQDFERAAEVLKTAGFTQNGGLQYHDISLIYGNTNLELHFSICENMSVADSGLEKIWDNVEAAQGRMYLETKDFFAFHHVAHMAHHFMCGGCGIRTFLDLWVLKRNGVFNYETVGKMCEEVNLGVFFGAVMRLTEVWFEDGSHDGLTRRMEDYLLSGGAYGSYTNVTAASTVKKGGKARYLLSVTFPSRKNMELLYPALKKVPVLLPFCYMHRVLEKTFGKKGAAARRKFTSVKAQDKQFVKNIAELIGDLGLDTQKES